VLKQLNQKLQVDTPTAYIRDKEGQATPYNTAENDSEKPLLLDKDGIKYELVSIQEGSAAEKGTLREGEQHVVYQYRKVVEVPSVKVGNVHARYVILGTETELASVKTVKSEAPNRESVKSTLPKEMGISIPSESESPKFISTQTTENRPNKGVLTSSKKPTNKSVLPTTGEESNRTLGVVGITLVATTATLAASSLKRRKN